MANSKIYRMHKTKDSRMHLINTLIIKLILTKPMRQYNNMHFKLKIMMITLRSINNKVFWLILAQMPIWQFKSNNQKYTIIK